MDSMETILSDTRFESSDVEILIGSDLWGTLITGNIVKLRCGLTAVESVLGWTLSGEIKQGWKQSLACSVITMLTHEERSLSDLWSLESIGIKDSAEKISQEEHDFELKESFQRSIAREEDGRYSIRLPWINESMTVPNNKCVAEKRLISATRKIVNEDKFSAYDEVFNLWHKEGIIEEIRGSNEAAHFLPHRPVFKDSVTTPVRPVFDASCRMGKGPSLNDCLEKGPNLLEVIPSILLRFRMNKIGVISDIRKAFQMISVYPEDRKFQQFLWWENHDMKKICHSSETMALSLVGVILIHNTDYNISIPCLKMC